MRKPIWVFVTVLVMGFAASGQRLEPGEAYRKEQDRWVMRPANISGVQAPRNEKGEIIEEVRANLPPPRKAGQRFPGRVHGPAGADYFAHAQQKAVVPVPIPVPEPEAAQLKASVEEYRQKVQALEEQYQTKWKLIIQHAALRARLSVEQADTMNVNPVLDAKGAITGYQWAPPKPEPAKPETPKGN